MKYKYDDVYDIVVSMAKTKMIMNAHKGNIENIPPDDLVVRGKQEFDELADAIKNGDYISVIEEVADILNFAVGAAYNAIEDYRSRK